MFNLLTDLLNLSPIVIFEIFFLLIEFFYISFALVLYRQQKLMIQTLQAPASPLIRTLTLINLFASVIVFCLTILLIL